LFITLKQQIPFSFVISTEAKRSGEILHGGRKYEISRFVITLTRNDRGTVLYFLPPFPITGYSLLVTGYYFPAFDCRLLFFGSDFRLAAYIMDEVCACAKINLGMTQGGA
jgi:hypothetical protein